jgi:hypothetical protein
MLTHTRAASRAPDTRTHTINSTGGAPSAATATPAADEVVVLEFVAAHVERALSTTRDRLMAIANPFAFQGKQSPTPSEVVVRATRNAARRVAQVPPPSCRGCAPRRGQDAPAIEHAPCSSHEPAIPDAAAWDYPPSLADGARGPPEVADRPVDNVVRRAVDVSCATRH